MDLMENENFNKILPMNFVYKRQSVYVSFESFCDDIIL
jgi:hypothetical protein